VKLATVTLLIGEIISARILLDGMPESREFTSEEIEALEKLRDEAQRLVHMAEAVIEDFEGRHVRR